MLPEMLKAARRLGRRAYLAKQPVTDCPYATDGGGDQRAAARAWVGAWLKASAKPSTVDFDDDDGPAS